MTDDVIRPAFHHVNLKTTRLQEMVDFYALLVGAEVIQQDAMGAWLTNDRANHRIALLAFPGVVDDPDRERHTGLPHVAYEYANLADLDATYLRLRDAGIEPVFCLDHGMTISYYYADPDGNHVELQIDAFGDWAWSKAWMKNSAEFKADPIGRFVDPAALGVDHAAGVPFPEIHEKAMRGGYAPERRPLAVPEPSA